MRPRTGICFAWAAQNLRLDRKNCVSETADVRFLSSLTHTTLNLDGDKVMQRPLKDTHKFNYGAAAAMLSVHPQCLCHADGRRLLLCLSPGFKTMY